MCRASWDVLHPVGRHMRSGALLRVLPREPARAAGRRAHVPGAEEAVPGHHAEQRRGRQQRPGQRGHRQRRRARPRASLLPVCIMPHQSCASGGNTSKSAWCLIRFHARMLFISTAPALAGTSSGRRQPGHAWRGAHARSTCTMRGQQCSPVAAACRPGTAKQRVRPWRWPLRRARRAQYDLTWFVNPNNLPYFEVVALEHGYIRGEVNATHFHIQARPTARVCAAPAHGPAAARLARSPGRVACTPGSPEPKQRAPNSLLRKGFNSVQRSRGSASPSLPCLGVWLLPAGSPGTRPRVPLHACSGRGRARAQSLGSQSGLVIDDFTLRKPVGWQPNPGARLLVLNQGFQSNYTETFIEARRPARQGARTSRARPVWARSTAPEWARWPGGLSRAGAGRAQEGCSPQSRTRWATSPACSRTPQEHRGAARGGPARQSGRAGSAPPRLEGERRGAQGLCATRPARHVAGADGVARARRAEPGRVLQHPVWPRLQPGADQGHPQQPHAAAGPGHAQHGPAPYRRHAGLPQLQHTCARARPHV